MSEKNRIYNRRVFRISVRSLVEFLLRSGSLELRGGLSAETAMLEGARIHRTLQKKEGPGYWAEVALSREIAVATEELTAAGAPIGQDEQFFLRIEGRADGIFLQTHFVIADSGKNEELWIIDEIKTVFRGFRDLKKPSEVHLAQARCYAWMYAEKEGLGMVGVRMTYCSQVTGEVKYFYEAWDFSKLTEWLENLIAEYVPWLAMRISFEESRMRTLREMVFPFPYRDGQYDLAAGVYRTIVHGRKLFLQAPTGTGKTMAVLFPSLKAIGEGKAERIFYLTAKAVAGRAASEALTLLYKKGLSVRSLVLTSKERICPCEAVDCNPSRCSRANGHYDRVNEALREMLLAASGGEPMTAEVVAGFAEKYRVCPYELSLDASDFADVIICDYNYVFHPEARLTRFFGEKGHASAVGGTIFLIDEAHNLLERGREMYSASLSYREVRRFRSSIKTEWPRLWKKMKDLVHVLRTLDRNYFGRNAAGPVGYSGGVEKDRTAGRGTGPVGYYGGVEKDSTAGRGTGPVGYSGGVETDRVTGERICVLPGWAEQEETAPDEMVQAGTVPEGVVPVRAVRAGPVPERIKSDRAVQAGTAPKSIAQGAGLKAENVLRGSAPGGEVRAGTAPEEDEEKREDCVGGRHSRRQLLAALGEVEDVIHWILEQERKNEALYEAVGTGSVHGSVEEKKEVLCEREAVVKSSVHGSVDEKKEVLREREAVGTGSVHGSVEEKKEVLRESVEVGADPAAKALNGPAGDRTAGEADGGQEDSLAGSRLTELLEFYFGIAHFRQMLEEMDGHYIVYVVKSPRSSSGGGFSLHLYCADPSAKLKECMEGSVSAILFSATFLPIQYYKGLLGGDPGDFEMYARSSFSPEQRKVIIVNDVTSRYRSRNADNYERIARSIAGAVSCRPGNYLAFFPSYLFLEGVFEAFCRISTVPLKAGNDSENGGGGLNGLRNTGTLAIAGNDSENGGGGLNGLRNTGTLAIAGNDSGNGGGDLNGLRNTGTLAIAENDYGNGGRRLWNADRSPGTERKSEDNGQGLIYDSGGAAVLSFRGKEFRVLAQKRRMEESERNAFLEAFEEIRSDRYLVGFCVMGGLFGEGIDLREDRLIGTFVVGTGIPPVDSRRELLRRYFSDSGQDGYDFAYRFPGMNKVLQAAGRVIRTETDRGVVLLLDERFGRAENRGLFPVEWGNPEALNSTEAAKTVRSFWEQQGDASD